MRRKESLSQELGHEPSKTSRKASVRPGRPPQDYASRSRERLTLSSENGIERSEKVRQDSATGLPVEAVSRENLLLLKPASSKLRVKKHLRQLRDFPFDHVLRGHILLLRGP